MRNVLALGCLLLNMALALPTSFVLPITSAPDSGEWTPSGGLNTPRRWHTATLLPDGQVLVTGGTYDDDAAELYDPIAGTWARTASMSTVRAANTATLLLDGRVLVVGGDQDPDSPGSAEIYDPATGTWSPTGSLNEGRVLHTATLLDDGRVLVAGGIGVSSELVATELYDPATGTWSLTGSLSTRRDGHTATLLPDGRVLVVGGIGDDGPLAGSEVYDPTTGTWGPGDDLSAGLYFHTATLLPDGRVLIAGGVGGAEGVRANAWLYDPAAAQGSAWSPAGAMNTARYLHTATLLPNGEVLVAGGMGQGDMTLASSEVYDPITGTWSPVSAMRNTRMQHTATLLASGRVLVAGGDDDGLYLASSEVYDPSRPSWGPTGSLNDGRSRHTATLLGDGRVLVAGGRQNESGAWLTLDSTETYDPDVGSWGEAAALQVPRSDHTATLLPGGQVLVTGGMDGAALAETEIYDPLSNRWLATAPLGTARAWHTATLLPDGQVLVAGGDDGTEQLSAVEVYDPVLDTWTSAGLMETARAFHTATLLLDGRAMVAGGLNDSLGSLSSAELYDPAIGTWIATGAMIEGRHAHTATLLPDGRVLVAGGMGAGNAALASSELYDPATGTWIATGSLAQARAGQRAILLPDGRPLIVGGRDPASGYRATSEVYDPASGSWSLGALLDTGVAHYGLTLLADGRLLRSGGATDDGTVTSAEVFDRGLGFDMAWRPSLDTATSPLLGDNSMAIVGSGFRGYGRVDTSGGTNHSSATNYPLVQLRRVDNGAMRWLLPDLAHPFSDAAFVSQVVTGLPAGPYLVTLFVNGIPGVSRLIAAGDAGLPPLARDDVYATDQGVTLSIAAPGVLANDLDGALPAAPLTAIPKSSPAHGDLDLDADGSFVYTPDVCFHGVDTFTYSASDGELDSTAVVSLTVKASTGLRLVDLALVKTASASEVWSGATLTYTLVLTNLGPCDSTTVTVTDWLSSAVSLSSAAPNCVATDRLVTCLPGPLPAGTTADLSFSVRVDERASGTLFNSAWITSADLDPDLANNEASAAVQMIRLHKLYLPLLERNGE